MKIDKCRKEACGAPKCMPAHMTGSNIQAGSTKTGSRIRHDMDETACLAPLDRLHAQSLAVQRMPTVANDSFLPDMGRMTG